jgi:hypothetical protein
MLLWLLHYLQHVDRHRRSGESTDPPVQYMLNHERICQMPMSRRDNGEQEEEQRWHIKNAW